ncbi:MAG: hypothetical protein ABFS56_17695 [Pseudomonadota bacterium]
MNKNTIDRYQIQVNPFKEIEVKEVLDFADIPLLYVEIDSTGKLYLNYLDQFINDNLEQRFVIQISEKRLKYLKKGKMSVGETFCHPETPFIFLTHVNQLDGCIKEIYLLPNEVFQTLNTVRTDYFLSIEEESASFPEFNVVKADKLLFDVEKFIEEQKLFFEAAELLVAQEMVHIIKGMLQKQTCRQ